MITHFFYLFFFYCKQKLFLWHGNKILWILNQQCLKLVALIKYAAAAWKIHLIFFFATTIFFQNKFTTTNFYFETSFLISPKSVTNRILVLNFIRKTAIMCHCQSLKIYNKHNSLLSHFLPFILDSCRDIS